MTYSVQQTTMLQGIERYMKQAIVDKVSSVSSSALVSSLVSHTYPHWLRGLYVWVHGFSFCSVGVAV